jgi:hypothetical protein
MFCPCSTTLQLSSWKRLCCNTAPCHRSMAASVQKIQASSEVNCSKDSARIYRTALGSSGREIISSLHARLHTGSM